MGLQEKKQIGQQGKKQKSTVAPWISGISFTFFIALLGFLLAKVPGFHLIGQLASAIIIAILYRQFFGYPEGIKTGIVFSSKKLLRLAIILYGLKLNIQTILQEGLALLFIDVAVITFSILFMIWLAKKLKANPTISILLGVGTGVCGAAAIGAIAPIIQSKDEETAMSVGMISLVGTIFAITYVILRPLMPLSDHDFGIWSGISLHEIAQVVLAAAAGGEDGLAMGLLAKLGRVFLLIPLCFIFIFWMKRKSVGDGSAAKIDFPWFLIGFIAMSFFGSYIMPAIPNAEELLGLVSGATTWIMTAAMVGLGLNVSLADVRQKAWRPLIALSITSFLLSVVTLIFYLI